MIKLLEENVEIKVREDEVDMVKRMLESCQDEFAEIMHRETTREYSCQLTVI